MFIEPINLNAVIPVANKWKSARKGQPAFHYLGKFKSGHKILIDATDKKTPVLEACGRRYPMLQEVDGRYIIPQVSCTIRVRLNEMSACITAI
jgi:hypothetical protein